MSPLSSTVRRLVPALFVVWIAACGSNPQTYVDRGRKFFDMGKYDDAAIQFQKAIQKSPKLGEAHYRLGLLELKRNHPVQAYRELRVAVELMPGDREALARLGQLSLSLYNADAQHPQQLYDQATKASEQLLIRNAQDFDGNLLKGALALAEKKPADAIPYLRKSIQVKPDDPAAKLGLARALAQDGQVPAGLDLAQEIIRKDKVFGAAYDFLYEQYAAAGKMEDAENILKLKVSNNPKDAASILELSRYYATARKPAEMNETLRKLLDRPDIFPNGPMLAGDFYGSIGQPDEALRQYGRGLQSNSKAKTPYQKRTVRVLAGQHRWPEALEQLKAILKDQPGDDEAKLVRALVWLDEGKPENLDPAIAELRAQLAKRPQDATLLFQVGNALARKGDQDGAHREWSAAALQNRAYLPPRYALVQMNLAQGKAQEALTISEEIIATAPGDPQAQLLHATCLTANRQFQQARTELTRLGSRFPGSPEVRFRIGTLALAEGKFKEAEQNFRRLEGGFARDPQVLAALAQAYQGQNESSKALQLLQQELTRNPNSPILRQALARFAMASRSYEMAIEQYKEMLDAAPNSVPVQLSLAAAYTAKGDVNAAIPILAKAVRTDPKSVVASLSLAQAYVSAGKTVEAKAQYRRALSMDPNNPNAMNDLAYLLAESGENLDEALALAQRGRQGTVTAELRASLSDTLGWIYLKKRMDDSALQTFQNLVRKNPTNSTYLYHLGATFYQKGDKIQARVELEAALRAKPGPADEPKIRELLARL